MTHLHVTPLLGSALQFAFEKATIEGKITIGTLVVVSIVSWTVMITKSLQLYRARTMARKFFAAFRALRDPLELHRKKEYFDGAPAFEVYHAAAEELVYHLQNNPVNVKGHTKISASSYDSVRVTLERAVGAEALSLEKGMIVLSTAVAGGPFIGLLGTVWGVMETFSGIATAKSASLTAMAPGVAGALIATVTGLMVAIPAMFAYNFMVTSIRAITQELDNFASEYGTQIEHRYVDARPLAEEIADALRSMERQAIPA
ncbi:MAG TPA: MotA/TolQ/ExbB proton channel family protein [Verrucomicrobiae bacterium]|jgi:biopolymer transport protein ExbB/TolQ|nr:MotA/TolQ/ExbB proton channel family protein [Verrucomicrobiae bacterium]